MAHAIIPDEEHDFLELGRLVGKIFLRRGRKRNPFRRYQALTKSTSSKKKKGL